MIAPALLSATAILAGSTALMPIDPGSWITSSDYPSRAMAGGMHGRVSFRLSIDTDGKPDACGILTSSGSQDLDSATCDLLLARGRFKAATGPDGRPIRGSYASAVLWIIPTAPEPWANRVVSVRTDLDATGAVTACTTTAADADGLDGCALFGRAENLARLVSTPLSKLRAIEVRFIQAVSGQPAAADDLPAGAVRTTVAKSVLTVDAAGGVASCKNDGKTIIEGRSLDLCAMRSGPNNRFPPAAAAQSRTMQLTLETVTLPR